MAPSSRRARYRVCEDCGHQIDVSVGFCPFCSPNNAMSRYEWSLPSIETVFIALGVLLFIGVIVTTVILLI